MARQPQILIADEPTGNLDGETSQGIVRLLEEINNFGTTILVTTHDENIVNQLRKRVITLRHGEIVGDQKNNGHYDLDGYHSKIVKRPLAHPNSHLSVETPAPAAEISWRAGSYMATRSVAWPGSRCSWQGGPVRSVRRFRSDRGKWPPDRRRSRGA